MKHNDNRCENLLLRVASYTPRVERNAEEDFCTEVLAWCLQNSMDFRSKFVLLLRKLNPAGLKGDPLISTQQAVQPSGGVAGAEGEEEETEEEDGAVREGSRFDLVLEHPGHQSWVVVVECKIGEDRKLPEQLSKYRKVLEGPRFQADETFLVTLTNNAEPPLTSDNQPASDDHLTWSEIEELAREIHDGSSQATAKPPEAFSGRVCGQFADFLKQKGMGHMKIRKYAPDQFVRWMDGIKFRQELDQVLVAVREAPSLKGSLRSSVEMLEMGGAGESYDCLVIQNRRGRPYLCVGFSLTSKEKDIPWFRMFVAGKPVKSSEHFAAENPKAERYDYETGTHFEMEQAIPGEKFDGKAEEMKDWLIKTARLFVE